MSFFTPMLMIASTALSAFGQIAQGNAQQAAANYNAQVSEMNAKIADQQAKDAIERGKQEEQHKRMATAQLEGKQKAAMAATGLDLSFGSPLDTLVDTAELGEKDALTIRTNTYREAYSHNVQAANLRNQASLQRMEGSAAKKAGIIGAVGTVLSGAAKTYSAIKNPSSGVGSIT